MSTSQLLDLWRTALDVLVTVGGPVIAVALAVGLVTSVLQAATQLSDSALSFIPKIAAILVVLSLGGGWMLGNLQRHLSDSMSRLVEIGQRGEP